MYTFELKKIIIQPHSLMSWVLLSSFKIFEVCLFKKCSLKVHYKNNNIFKETIE